MTALKVKVMHAACALSLILASATAHARPSVWARARNPVVYRRAQMLEQTQALLIKFERTMRTRGGDTRGFVGPELLELHEARRILEEGGVPSSRDMVLRHRYAEILFRLATFEPRHYERAAAHFEWVLKSEPPAAMQLEIYPELAICYAKLGRSKDEIGAYTAALNLQPHGVERARMLANRAEAHMYLGNLAAAQEGYRAAIAGLSQIEMSVYGVTALWGLAVAVDRSGDLEEALASIRMARSYDIGDRHINSESWFYVPLYDRHWYEALGHWTAARHTDLAAIRAEAYGRAVRSWEDYITAAPAEDRWLPIARARLAQCEKERVAAQKRFRTKPKPPAGGAGEPRRRTE